MGLDIRLPIGLMFLILGVLLSGYGLLTINNAEIYSRSSGINVNLWWGMCLVFFGATMYFFGRRATNQNKTEGMHSDSIEGRLTEEREHKLNLEKE